MDRWPQEIFDLVATLASAQEAVRAFDRPRLATISRRWQWAFERQIFRTIDLGSHMLATFEQIVRGYRRRFLQKIRYVIFLPTYSLEAGRRLEWPPDRLANNEAFTAGIHGLFRILHTWDADDDGEVEVSVEVVCSPSDENSCRRPSIDEEATAFRRHRYSFLRLLRPDVLPEVRVISVFSTQEMLRMLGSQVAVDIVAKLPNLHTTCWFIRDSERRYPELRRRNRLGLAERVRQILPKASALRNLAIWLDHELILDQSWRPAHLGLRGSAPDPLSSAIRESTARGKALKNLVLQGTFDESLFWPEPAPTLVEPFWQGLTCLDIRFDVTCPTGGWYFRVPSSVEGPPASGSLPDGRMPPGYDPTEDQDLRHARHFSRVENATSSGYAFLDNGPLRSVPNEAKLVPLIQAFGRACSQIPTLRVADLYA